MAQKEVVPTAQELARGEDRVTLVYDLCNAKEPECALSSFSVSMSWNYILKSLFIPLLDSATMSILTKAVDSIGRTAYLQFLENGASEDEKTFFKEKQLVKISSFSLADIVIQFLALDYIVCEKGNGSWVVYKLTNTGRDALMQFAHKRGVDSGECEQPEPYVLCEAVARKPGHIQKRINSAVDLLKRYTPTGRKPKSTD